MLALGCQSQPAPTPPAPPQTAPLSAQASKPCQRLPDLKSYLSKPENRFPGENKCPQEPKGICFGLVAMNVATASLATFDPGQPADAAILGPALTAISAGTPAVIPGAANIAEADRVYGSAFRDAFYGAALRVQRNLNDPDHYLKKLPKGCERVRPNDENPIERIEPLLAAGNPVPLVFFHGMDFDPKTDKLSGGGNTQHIVLVLDSAPGLNPDQRVFTIFDPGRRQHPLGSRHRRQAGPGRALQGLHPQQDLDPGLEYRVRRPAMSTDPT